jgi:hypothetical protein
MEKIRIWDSGSRIKIPDPRHCSFASIVKLYYREGKCFECSLSKVFSVTKLAQKNVPIKNDGMTSAIHTHTQNTSRTTAQSNPQNYVQHTKIWFPKPKNCLEKIL